MTLGKLLLVLSVVSLLFASILIYAVSGVVRDHAVHRLAQEDARHTSQMIFQSLYSAMRKGWSKGEIREIIARINLADPHTKVRVFRGQVVTDQFGGMSGERQVIAQDPALARALRDGNDALLFPSPDTIRYLYPVVAKEECLVCHTQSHVGAVHGVIDVTYPISDLKVSFNYVLNSIVGYTLLVLALVFVALYFKLRYLVVTPLATFVDVMHRVTRDMDLSHRVSGGHLIVELRRLAEYFNHLLFTVQDYNAKLEELSIRDPLTGLYNRRKFEEFLEYEIIRAERHEYAFSVIMVDLDNFKYINDTYGHPIGDLTLKELSGLLAGELRKGDVLARLGGDEFALLLPQTPPENGLQVASKLHGKLSVHDFELPVGKIRVTASFSMVSYPEDGKSSDALHTAMDVVLYKAKKGGKNQVATAESDQDRTMMEIFKQGDFLRRALAEKRIEAFLQPIVGVNKHEVFAFEALARIRDGDVILSAGQFIEVAEELRMLQELDQVVFNSGLEQLQRLSGIHPDAKMFFNLSTATFRDAAWMRTIPEQVAKFGIPCDRIVIEVTEREALHNISQVKEIIDELRLKKIAFALDDFGSGFSSFLYLKYLTVDYVKIEGSFIQQIAIDARDRIMVDHIHRMANEFGLKTVAEFVEDQATADTLIELGVDYAQGYHFGRPESWMGRES
ncbi:MAG: EAL domain-containing protein [Gallionellaceae bacterium]|nr:MAG: EAL domain-containing protein [Gallionellaceae bacterium]